MSQDDLLNFARIKKAFTFKDAKKEFNISDQALRRSISKCFFYGKLAKMKIDKKKNIYLYK